MLATRRRPLPFAPTTYTPLGLPWYDPAPIAINDEGPQATLPSVGAGFGAPEADALANEQASSPSTDPTSAERTFVAVRRLPSMRAR